MRCRGPSSALVSAVVVRTMRGHRRRFAAHAGRMQPPRKWDALPRREELRDLFGNERMAARPQVEIVFEVESGLVDSREACVDRDRRHLLLAGDLDEDLAIAPHLWLVLLEGPGALKAWICLSLMAGASATNSTRNSGLLGNTGSTRAPALRAVSIALPGAGVSPSANAA